MVGPWTIKVSARAASLFRAEGAGTGARRDVCHARAERIHRNNRRTMVNRRHLAAALALLGLAIAGASAHAQWVASGALAAVPVVEDCTQTGGDVAVSRLDPPTVYLCRTVVRLVRQKDPGAEHFYFVHEFGHIALQTSDEAMADCWAARELAAVKGGRRSLAAAIALFRARADDSSRRYGSARERAERIGRCAAEAQP